MSEMVERVAKAMETRWNADEAQTWPELARAAIKAMRNPTEAMTDQAWNNDEVGLFGAKNLWQTMIDAALEEDV